MPERMSKAAQWYERYIARFLPRYALFSLPFVAAGPLLFALANALPDLFPRFNIMTAWDYAIPLRSEWILIYFGSYLFWVVNAILVARRGKDTWFRFLSAVILSAVIAFLCFLFFPATMTRPAITGDGVFDRMMRFLYAIDPPTNLLPSLHCSQSWLCAIGLHSERRIPRWYRVGSYVFALMVCASTLLVRQHCIADVIVGVAMAQGTYILFRKGSGHAPLMRLFDRLDRAVFKDKM